MVTSAIFSPIDENIIISGSDDRTVKIWDRRTLRSPRTVIRCSNGINRFAVSPLSSHLVIPMDDSRTKVCDLSGKQLGRLKSESKHVCIYNFSYFFLTFYLIFLSDFFI